MLSPDSAPYRGTPLQAAALKALVVEEIENMKGRDIVVLDVGGRSSITDCMVICAGNSKRHVQSIAEHVATAAKQAGVMPLGVEGGEFGEWVLVDLGNVVVHVMQEKARDFYQLEKLWGHD